MKLLWILSKTMLVCALSLLISCGASRKNVGVSEGEADIDELLGQEEQNTLDRASEEAEILKLLGITPEEEGQPKETQVSQVEEQEQPQPQSETPTADELRHELEAKDQEISKLRSELVEKESKISELQAQLQSKQRLRMTPITNNRSLKGAPSPEFKARYQEALKLFNSRQYQAALNIFSELLLTDPNNSLSDNCQYWIGECYYGLGNYNQAIVEFEKVFSFPNSNKSDDAQLKLGICYLKLGDRQQAKKEFELLISNYSDSEYVELARRYLSRL